ncbi:hypothetical protein [Bailinhaonella thermotolerans]|nr:hypothetical protein [Bailinhaonella thermotolerans]
MNKMAYVLQLQALDAGEGRAAHPCYSHVTSYNNTACKTVATTS